MGTVVKLKPRKKAKATGPTNKFKVPNSQWVKWGKQGQVTFNWLYWLMMESPDLFSHPKAIKANKSHWKTTAWNSAWLAADAVREALKARDEVLNA